MFHGQEQDTATRLDSRTHATETLQTQRTDMDEQDPKNKLRKWVSSTFTLPPKPATEHSPELPEKQYDGLDHKEANQFWKKQHHYGKMQETHTKSKIRTNDDPTKTPPMVPHEIPLPTLHTMPTRPEHPYRKWTTHTPRLQPPNSRRNENEEARQGMPHSQTHDNVWKNGQICYSHQCWNTRWRTPRTNHLTVDARSPHHSTM